MLTLTGDTLRGIVVERGQQLVALHSAPKAAPQIFRPAQVQGYGLRGRAAIRSQVVRLASGQDSTFFVVPVQLGRASLYAYPNETGLLLLPPAADTLQELTAINWHVLLNRYLTGCPTLDHSNNRIIQLSFTERNVRQVFMEYNQCLDPAWKSTPSPTRTVWRNGLGLQLTPRHQFLDSDGLLSKNSIPVGLEWVHVRASGLQTVLSVSYAAWSNRTELNPPFPQALTEEQTFYRQQTLDLAIGIGRRLGRPGRVAVVPGIGFGGLYFLHSEATVKERPRGSNIPLQTSNVYRGDNGLMVHAEATLGAVLPLGNHQEVRLGAFYRYYLYGVRGVWGEASLQLAYDWFRK
ncbi:hypothetical protein HNQ93_003910 [Hymenobacter luteus]|uniref:Uncharacterized protein n=2 Tax=Hymenobacter TaxID=89966 RepID=A0A7W9T562_9BACT|nr:hypothetical protein [Hymenobacter latericoloratus]MBB4603006.1 hypothetical protein [Hymenobacter latericoloratus]MBB6061034.1 hypothetical protein [Hymenobacter luteus]